MDEDHERKESGGGSDHDGLRQGGEGRPTKGAKSPVKPSKQEVDDHNRCHIPFRN